MTTSIYVHTPFCLARCGYCNFYSGEDHGSMEGFPDLVGMEANLRRGDFPDCAAETLYIGGGTPSLLGSSGLSLLVESIRAVFPLSVGAEVTVEVNPASMVDFSALRGAGVNRVSVGVQSLFDRHLKTLGRPHNAEEALKTLRLAHAAGHSISADLMYGFSGLKVEELIASAAKLVDAGVGHISAYSLETGGNCTVFPASEAEEEEQGDALAEYLESAGYERYEVSNYALPGLYSRHNTGYWEGWGYMGLGPGAHGYKPNSFPCGLRYSNAADLAGWTAALKAGRFPPGATESPDAAGALLERLFLTLRRTRPFRSEQLSDDPRLAEGFKRLTAAGDLKSLPDGSFRITKSGVKRADGLAVFLHDLIFGRSFGD